MASLEPDDLDISKLPRGPLGHLKAYAVADLLQQAAEAQRETLADKQRLATTVQALTARIAQLEAQVAAHEEAAAQRKDSDQLAGTLLASAQRAAREARESARQEAELTLKKAARRAAQVEDDAVRAAEQRLSELARIEALREEVAARLRATLGAIADRRGVAADNGTGPDAVATAPGEL
jgi:hypothetical protein